MVSKLQDESVTVQIDQLLYPNRYGFQPDMTPHLQTGGVMFEV
jgi:hypothetical protein